MSQPTTAASGLPSKLLLEAHHRFPGQYTFKMILPAGPDIENLILQTIVLVLTAPDRTKTSKRSSTSGRYESITLVIYAGSADEVLLVYKELARISGIKALF